MSFSSLHWDILISTFQKIPWTSSNYPPWKTFEVQNCENMENTLKINVFEKSILFRKYLHNGSSDPYEILYGGQLISCELKYQISWRSVHKCASTSSQRAHARFIASARDYYYWAVLSRIKKCCWMKRTLNTFPKAISNK